MVKEAGTHVPCRYSLWVSINHNDNSGETAKKDASFVIAQYDCWVEPKDGSNNRS